MRVGIGYDVHKFAEGRKLILGGVEIPYEKGLLGHSDADVIVHAIMDALLGAAALGDIGQHFPDTDPAYEGISSICLLEKVRQLLEDHHYQVGNIDSIIIAQQGHDRGGPWFYRARRRDRSAGSVHAGEFITSNRFDKPPSHAYT